MPQAVVDSELVRGAQRGDQKSLDALAMLVRERVYAYLCRTTLDSNAAEDLTQDTMVAVLRSVACLRQVERFWPWVLTIASNNVRQQCRARSAARIAQNRLRESKQSEAKDSHDPTTEADCLRAEWSSLMRVAMERINHRDRAVLALRTYNNMPYAQIADLLGCSHLAARVAFVRARRSLVEALRSADADYLPEAPNRCTRAMSTALG